MKKTNRLFVSLFILSNLIFFISRGVEKKLPKISIITSVFNGDKFIKAFLDDITRQTIFNQCELIMINANSPGKEEPIIHLYMKRFPNIVYIKLKKDPGLYGTWNIGVEHAHGKYLTNANLDDRLSPHCYEVHAKTLDENHHIDLVYSDGLETLFINETFEKNRAKRTRSCSEFTPSLIKTTCPPSFNPMWRKSIHDRFGLFNPTFRIAGDWEMWVRMVSQGAQFKKVPGCYGLCYRNPVGLSTSLRTRKILFKENKRVKEIHQKFFRTHCL